MAEITITVIGGPEIIARLNAAVGAAALTGAMTKALARVQAELQQYPAPPANSTYVRTGDLGRSWTTPPPLFSGGMLMGQLGNAVRSRTSGQPYAGFVQGGPASDPHQTTAHGATGWLTDEQVVQHQLSAIEGDFRAAVDAALA